jgi:hypothetical protein
MRQMYSDLQCEVSLPILTLEQLHFAVQITDTSKRLTDSLRSFLGLAICMYCLIKWPQSTVSLQTSVALSEVYGKSEGKYFGTNYRLADMLLNVTAKII